MKNIKFKLIGVLILSVLVLGSCKKWIDTGINVNPDAPADAPMSSLLPAVEANMAYNLMGGNDYSRLTSIWMQYYQGIARQSQSEANYIWHDGDCVNLWGTSYSGTMMNLVQMKNKAVAANNKTFLGISDVLMAMTIGSVTDIWGDVPFSEAFQGLGNLNPVFDTQQEIYSKIRSMLDDAIANLSDADAHPVDGDMMYGGDPSLWLKAAYGIKARYILHTCKVDNAAFADALAAVNNALTSNGDNMFFPFANVGGQENPLFQFMDQRTDIMMHKSFIDTLIHRFDPRLTAFAAVTDTGGYAGAGWGSTGADVSAPGPGIADAGAPVYFLTYAECMFIKAECEFKTHVADAQVITDLIAGLSASLAQYGVSSDIYVGAYTARMTGVTGDPLYKEIMMQKYISLCNSAETYNDWRRTNNVIGLAPNPTTAAIKNEIPRRYPYSLDEKSYNTNTPKNVSIWDRVWWDTAKK